jgi:hypothetical protein
LVLQARELLGRLPALIITGYVGAEELDCLSANTPILRKPFRREDLVRRVKDLIETAALEPRSEEGQTGWV